MYEKYGEGRGIYRRSKKMHAPKGYAPHMSTHVGTRSIGASTCNYMHASAPLVLPCNASKVCVSGASTSSCFKMDVSVHLAHLFWNVVILEKNWNIGFFGFFLNSGYFKKKSYFFLVLSTIGSSALKTSLLHAIKSKK